MKWNLIDSDIKPPHRCDLWLALSDGSVKMGDCLHHEGQVHSWFVEARHTSCLGDVKILAWTLVETPHFPDLLNVGKDVLPPLNVQEELAQVIEWLEKSPATGRQYAAINKLCKLYASMIATGN